MKGSGIGGQAVMEGVMMKNGDKYAVSVRKPDHEIVVDVKEYNSLGSRNAFFKLPIIRGMVAFIDSMILGVGTLTYSASFFEDEEETSDKNEEGLKTDNASSDKNRVSAEDDETEIPEAEEDEEDRPLTPEEKKKEQTEKLVMAGTVCLAVVLAVGIFMLLPYFLSRLLGKVIESEALLAFVEGVIRVALFVGYVAAISMMQDIKRVFMYHGAEHKSINCIEHGLDLTVENVRGQSREHKRCGTSFLLIVMLISVVFFMFIRVDNAWLRIVVRLALIPVIAGISYEFIRLAGRKDNKLVDILSKPGLALQKLTTKEPDDEMIEVAIKSVEAVFDWKEFVEGYRNEEANKARKEKEEALKAAEEAKAEAEMIKKAKEEARLAEAEARAEAKAAKEAEAKAAKEAEAKAAKAAKEAEAKAAKEVEAKAAKEAEAKAAKEAEAKAAKEAEAKAAKEAEAKAAKEAEAKAAKEAEAKAAKEAEAKAAKEAEAKAAGKPEGKPAGARKEIAKGVDNVMVDLTRPEVVDDEEDDEILKALDQYFILKQKKDNK